MSLYPDENGRSYPATILVARPGQQQMAFPDSVWQPRKERQGALGMILAEQPFGAGVDYPDAEAPGGIGTVEQPVLTKKVAGAGSLPVASKGQPRRGSIRRLPVRESPRLKSGPTNRDST